MSRTRRLAAIIAADAAGYFACRAAIADRAAPRDSPIDFRLIDNDVILGDVVNIATRSKRWSSASRC
jgi:hypothetical protein